MYHAKSNRNSLANNGGNEEANSPSVHLKLYEKDMNENNRNNKDMIVDREGYLTIYEFIDLQDNVSSIACTGGQQVLEHFSKHIFDANCSEDSRYHFQEVYPLSTDLITLLNSWLL